MPVATSSTSTLASCSATHQVRGTGQQQHMQQQQPQRAYVADVLQDMLQSPSCSHLSCTCAPCAKVDSFPSPVSLPPHKNTPDPPPPHTQPISCTLFCWLCFLSVTLNTHPNTHPVYLPEPVALASTLHYPCQQTLIATTVSHDPPGAVTLHMPACSP
jgi:hypothetical protein